MAEQQQKADAAADAAAAQAAAKVAGLNISEAQAATMESVEGNEVAATVEELQGKHGAVAAANAGKVETQKKEELLEAIYGDQIRAMMAAKEANLVPKHRFWDTQPMPKLAPTAPAGGPKKSKREEEEAKAAAEAAAAAAHVGPLDKEKTPADVRQEPLALPKGFHWSTIDVADEVQLKEAYTLLTENYVEDDDNMFRFDYSPEFLRWALKPPGFFKEWTVGVRSDSGNKRLLAMITGIPARTHVFDKTLKTAEINFLCIHKKLRSKRLAPMLIKEVTRRVNLEDQWQAVYTAGVRIPTPIGVAQYFHRSLNPKKLISVGFSRLQPRMTMARTVRLYSVPDEPKLKLVPLEPRHCASAAKLLAGYLCKCKVWIEMDAEEIEHWLVTREEVVYSYVVEKPGAPDEVTDMCSFYNLPSTIIGNAEYNHLKAAYSFYNVATSCSLKELMADALVFANQNGFDVFNALNLMDNAEFLKDLKFGEGDGRLHYYLYNYGVGPEMPPSDIGVVLL